jgi:DNA (cytosine-5)-methyltransferase 1
VIALDLFAGPGGWDQGIRDIGIVPIGIEWDDAACDTRLAAGHIAMRADIAQLDPHTFNGVDLLIASPPCQAFSAAGKGDGHKDTDTILGVVDAMLHDRDTRADVRDTLNDPRSLLVVEPLRWALAIEPTYIALEQVPPVLPLWEKFADVLRWRGWSTWTGLLSAEQYGVPQTRQRAILMASRAGKVTPPTPTHQRYVPMRKEQDEPSLFDAGARERIILPGEEQLLPWISMAEALGWGVTGKARTAEWVYRNGNQPNAAARSAGEPAPTVHFGHALNDVEWIDPYDLKAPDWYTRRPATTIAGDSRVFQPGNHRPEVPGEQSQNAIRVQTDEASILQSFPPDYPWQGSRTKQFEQIGNAVPPLLARAIIQALIGDQR